MRANEGSAVPSLRVIRTIDDIRAPSTLNPLADRRIGAPNSHMSFVGIGVPCFQSCRNTAA